MRLRRSPRFDAETAGWRIDTQRLLWLTVAAALVLLPHVLRIPVWISVCFGVLAGWRLAAALRGMPLSPRWLLALLAVGFVPAVWASYGTVLGRDAGVAMLVFLTGMKLLETRSPRDAYVVCFLGYFLVITNFLYSQSVFMGLYMVAVVLATTATLVALNSGPDDGGTRERLRVGAVLLAQAVPVMLLLFVLFPRVPGPLWGLPKDAYAGISGLSEDMHPGSISSVGLSEAVAFRVSFDGEPPPLSRLYWRGPVLWETDGRRWSRDERRDAGGAPPVQTFGPAVRYTVTLEPHQRRWLFALDVPTQLPPGARLARDNRLLSRSPVRERKRYEVTSSPDYRLGGLTAAERHRALDLPDGQHPRTHRLAQEWRAETGDDRALVERALTYFREQPFFYTLQPPALTGDVVDEFLFLSRKGFCEHYAAAFVTLMRAAGVPARVVTGYQGGEPNPVGDYLIVRQRDAHAWAEVWLGNDGWVRVDPTAAVSPARIERGMEAALTGGEGAGTAFALEAGSPLHTALRQVRHGWDTINNGWNQWVLGYGPNRQRELLAQLGLDSRDWRWLGLALMVLLALALAVLTAWLLRPRGRRDEAVRLYAQLCRRLARVGVRRVPHEGPRDFQRRVARERPDLARAVARVVDHYVALRYAGGGDLRALREAVAAVRPGVRHGVSPMR